MKKYFIFILVMSCVLTQNKAAYAEYEISTTENLQASLMSLRDTVDQVERQNQQFKKDIILLNRQIEDLNVYAKSLEERKARAQQNIRTSSAQLPIAPTPVPTSNIDDLKNQLRQILNEQSNLEWEVDSKNKQINGLRNNVSQLRDQSLARKAELKKLHAVPFNEDFARNKRYWTDLIAQAQKDVRESEKRLNQTAKVHARPSQTVSSLEDKQSSLKQELTFLNEDWKSLLDEEKAIRREMEDRGSQAKSQDEDLDKEIERLQARQTELKTILREAKAKLGNKNIASMTPPQELGDLKQNLDIVQQVNSSLKNQFETLEKTLAGPQP